jgi:hypothetical protein
MKQDNPFAKLGAIDQKLFEDTASIKQEKVDKEVEENVRKSESQQNDLSESQQSGSQADLSTKTAKRFTTYLTKASLRAIRNIADDEDRHDYEVFQEAVDFYLTNRKQ